MAVYYTSPFLGTFLKAVKGCLRIANRIPKRVINAPTTIITTVRIRKLNFVVTLAMALCSLYTPRNYQSARQATHVNRAAILKIKSNAHGNIALVTTFTYTRLNED